MTRAKGVGKMLNFAGPWPWIILMAITCLTVLIGAIYDYKKHANQNGSVLIIVYISALLVFLGGGSLKLVIYG